ncbi:hypothetical protein P7C71_g3975, partial [Lecanoromycetidae sp. Uapishka_2]
MDPTQQAKFAIHEAAREGRTNMGQGADEVAAISEGHGDTALVLLKAGAETDKKDVDGNLAIDLAPDRKIRQFIMQSAEREGIEFS